MRLKSPAKYFLIPTFLVILLGGFFLVFYPKDQIHLYINGFHTPVADKLFWFFTNLGEGWLFLAALPVFYFFSWRSGISIALAGLFTASFTGVFKNVLFNGEPRPFEYFKGINELYFVPGVEIHHWNSFPSGHTMAAFALYFSLAYVVNRKLWSLLFFIIALLVGYSRMYLSQHFLVDVVAGAGLGVLASSLAIIITSKLKWKFLDSNASDLFKSRR